MAPPLATQGLADQAEGLRRLARSLVGDTDAADDIVQDAFVAALRRGPTDGAPLRPWLVRVVRNLSARWWRGRARSDRRLRSLVVPVATPPADEILDRARLHRRLMRVLTALDEPYRTTLLLRYFDDLPPRVIALRLNAPAATVRTWIHRGLAQLRERLDSEHDERRAWVVAFLPMLGDPPRKWRVSTLGGLVVASKTWFAVAAGVVLLVGAGALYLAAPDRDGAPSRDDARFHSIESASSTLAVQPSDGRPKPADAKPTASTEDEHALHGVVTDGTGKVIAGARVAMFRAPWGKERDANGHPVEIAGESMRTADDGAFTLPLSDGDVVHLRVSAAGFATRVLDDARSGQRVTIVLGAGVSLTVRAVDERGGAVAAARIRLWAPRNWQSPSPGVEASGTTDDDGRCVFDGLPKGSWTMLDAVHRTLGSPLSRRVELPPRGPAEQTVVLLTGRTLSGRVINLEGGEPIATARVGLGWSLFRAVTTNAAGEFELPGYTGEGYFQLFAEAAGFSSGTESVSAENRYELSLAPGAMIVGRVVTVAGTPIAGAQIRASGGDVTQRRYTTSGVDGRFELDGARRAAVQTLLVAASGFGRTHLDVRVLDADRFDAGDVVLPVGRMIHGVVLGVDGKPVGDVAIQLEGTNRDRGRLLPSHTEPPADPMRGRQTTQTDGLGQFRFADLAPARYDVAVSPRGRRGIARSIEVGEAADVRGIEFRLSGSRRLRARVRDSAGRPLAGVTVSATATDGYFLNVATDADGEAVFWSDEPIQAVEASPDMGSEAWMVPEKRRLAASDTDVDFVFEPAVLARGVVLGLDGRPVGWNQFLRVTRDGVALTQHGAFSGNQTNTDGSGRFRVRVPVGAALEVEALESVLEDGTVIGGRIEGVVGGAIGLELRLRALANDRRLRVLVLGPDGKPVADVQVFIRVGGRNIAGANHRTGADGRVTFEGLPETGAYVTATPLSGSAGYDRWMPISEPIRPHGEERTLRFREARVVHGVVRSANGMPAKNAVITVLQVGEKDAPISADGEGKFVLFLDPATVANVRIAAATIDERSPFVELPADGSPLNLTLTKP